MKGDGARAARESLRLASCLRPRSLNARAFERSRSAATLRGRVFRKERQRRLGRTISINRSGKFKMFEGWLSTAKRSLVVIVSKEQPLMPLP